MRTFEERLEKARTDYANSTDPKEKERIRKRGEFWKRCIEARERNGLLHKASLHGQDNPSIG